MTCFHTPVGRFVAFGVAVLFCTVLARAEEQDGRGGIDTETITLTITLQDHLGQPIADAPLEAGSLVESQFEMTNANGEAFFKIEKLTDEDTINVRLSDGLFTPIVPPSQREFASSRFHALRVAHAFKPCYLIAVDGDAPYAATVRTKESVTISGRVLDGGRQPRVTNLAPRSSSTYDIVLPSELGVFSFGGIPRSEHCELWIAGEISQMHMISIAALSLDANFVVGDLTIEDTPRDSTLRLQLNQFEDISVPSKVDVRGSVTLVAKDDAEFHVFDVESDGTVISSGGPGGRTTDLAIPAGAYYVVPGSFGSVSSFALLESVRAGRRRLLDAAGAVTVRAAAGQTAAFTINAQAAFDAVMVVGSDLVCPCQCD